MKQINNWKSEKNEHKNFQEILQSEEFRNIIWWTIKEVGGFDSEYIQEIFKKLQEWDVKLKGEEKKILSSFWNNLEVRKKLSDSLHKIHTSLLILECLPLSSDEKKSLSSEKKELLELFPRDGYKKLQDYMSGVLDSTHAALASCEWFTIKRLTLKDGEKKEVYMEDSTLKVDSTDWKNTNMTGQKVKINPKWNIIEYLEGEDKWEQLFYTQRVAMREALRQWKRLPDDEELNSAEYKQALLSTTKVFPGYLSGVGPGISSRGTNASFWSSSPMWRGSSLTLDKWVNEPYFFRGPWSSGHSIRCLKDPDLWEKKLFSKNILTLEDGEKKEVYIDNATLRVDSANWKETEIFGHKVKMNLQWDIIEYLDGEEKWEQLFTLEAAMRESLKQWKRLPDDKELKSLEYRKFLGNITKVFSGVYWGEGNANIQYRGDIAYFWSSSTALWGPDYASYTQLIGWDREANHCYFEPKTCFFSVCCIRN